MVAVHGTCNVAEWYFGDDGGGVLVCGVVGSSSDGSGVWTWTRYGPSLRFGPLFLCGFYTVR